MVFHNLQKYHSFANRLQKYDGFQHWFIIRTRSIWHV